MDIETIFYKNMEQLYKDIREDNLESAKTIVNWLNENCSQEKNPRLQQLLDELDPLTNFINIYNNTTIDYIINNLIVLSSIIFVQWSKIILNAQINENKFIELTNNFINNSNIYSKYIEKLSFLRIKMDIIRLCYIKQRFDLLEQITNKEE